MLHFLTPFIALYLAALAFADSLAEVEHIVLFMQENRAFDHYFVSRNFTSILVR